MNGMCIKDDAHLQKALRYYIASGKTEAGVVLNLDADPNSTATDKFFKLSKISIALLQTINAGGANNVKVTPCATDGNPRIIITQDGCSDSETEVPDLNKVFDTTTPVNVYLSKDDTWTWKERTGANQLTVDAGVAKLTLT